jgi:hypothetical protein
VGDNFLSPDDGNRSLLRKVVFSRYLEPTEMEECTNVMILSVMHHRQNFQDQFPDEERIFTV